MDFQKVNPMLLKDTITNLSPRRKTVAALLGITMLCSGLLLLNHFLFPEQGRDSMLYIGWIKCWHEGGFKLVLAKHPGYYLPPFYFYIGHLFMYAGLSAETAGLCISMLCGMFMPLITFAMAYEITQKKNISLIAALLVAANPILIELACCVQRDMPYLCFFTLSCYLFIAGIRRNKWFCYLLSGLVFMLSFLTRYEAIEFLPLVVLYFVLALLFRHDKWYYICRNFLLFLAGVTVSGVLLLTAMDTSDAKMIKLYQKFYKDKMALTKRLYRKKPQKTPGQVGKKVIPAAKKALPVKKSIKEVKK